MSATVKSILVLASLTLAPPLSALDPARALTRARVSVGTSESGLRQNSVDVILQTRDGYLGLGTEEGLVRLDGILSS